MTEPIRLARPDVGGRAGRPRRSRAHRPAHDGAKVSEFEDAIAHAIGTAHAAAVSSGTAALHLALLALEIGRRGHRPRLHLPGDRQRRRALRRTRCPGGRRSGHVQRRRRRGRRVGRAEHARVMAVHLFGRPVDWEALQTAVPQDVVLVEDAAGALGALSRNAVRRSAWQAVSPSTRARS